MKSSVVLMVSGLVVGLAAVVVACGDDGAGTTNPFGSGDTAAVDMDDADTTTDDDGSGDSTTTTTTTSGTTTTTTGDPTTSTTTTTSGGSNCGNGVQEPGEQCDGNDFGGVTGCQQLGFGGGTLACDPVNCTFDTSNCIPDMGGSTSF